MKRRDKERGYEAQCVMCGRFMDEQEATMKVVMEGYYLKVCRPCFFLLPMFEGKTVQGAQKFIARVMNPIHLEPGQRVFVTRRGVPFAK